MKTFRTVTRNAKHIKTTQTWTEQWLSDHMSKQGTI